MAKFEYESVLTSGGNSSGTIDAIDRADAVRLLRRRGEVAVRVSPAGGGGTAAGAPRKASAKAERKQPAARARRENGRVKPRAQSALSPSSAADSMERKTVVRGGSISRNELTSFIREVATALEAGLPLMASLRVVAQQSASVKQLNLVDHLMDRIEAGRSFAQAAAEWGPPFNDMMLGMLRAGEASGHLDKVMLQLADLLDRDGDIRRKVRGALLYPAFLMVLLAAGITVIVTFTIPRILSVVGDQGIQMPWPTRVVQGTADFVSLYWWVILGGLVVGFFVFRSGMQQPNIRLGVHGAMLRVPVLGRLLRDVAVGRFSRMLGTMMNSGIGVLEGLEITRDTLGNKALESVIDDVVEQVRGGRAIADPLEESGLFPSLLVQIVSLGERSGKLDVMLLQAADSFDRKTQESINLFTTVLPPAILVVMAGAVLFVLAAAILPLIEMQSMIG